MTSIPTPARFLGRVLEAPATSLAVFSRAFPTPTLRTGTPWLYCDTGRAGAEGAVHGGFSDLVYAVFSISTISKLVAEPMTWLLLLAIRRVRLQCEFARAATDQLT